MYCSVKCKYKLEQLHMYKTQQLIIIIINYDITCAIVNDDKNMLQT